jgi:hypothetical protein
MSRLEQTNTSATTPTVTAASLANERKLADKQRRNAGREVKQLFTQSLLTLNQCIYDFLSHSVSKNANNS